jgi:hypothetical protein
VNGEKFKGCDEIVLPKLLFREYNRHTKITNYLKCNDYGYLFNFKNFKKKGIDLISIIMWCVLIFGILFIMYIFFK